MPAPALFTSSYSIILPALILCVVFGLCLGSFATALIYRYRNNLPVFGTAFFSGKKRKDLKPETNRSFCPSCHHILGIKDLFPVLSFCLSGGKCRYCNQAIPAFYPLTEISSAILCILILVSYGLSFSGVAAMFAVPFLLALVIIDFQSKLMPDKFTIPFAILGFLFSYFQYSIYETGFVGPVPFFLIQVILGIIVYGGLAIFIRFMGRILFRKEALGMGDVKFIASCGIWLSVTELPLFLILSGIFGIILGGYWLKIRGEREFPFGPALIAGFLTCLVFNSVLLTSY